MPSAGGPPAKSTYKCLVPDCNILIRGDRLKEHYTSKVDFELLSSIKSLDKSLATAKIDEIQNLDNRKHTSYFYDNKKFSPHDIPNYKSHKRPLEKRLNLFERCKSARGPVRPDEDVSQNVSNESVNLTQDDQSNQPSSSGITAQDMSIDDSDLPLTESLESSELRDDLSTENLETESHTSQISEHFSQTNQVNVASQIEPENTTNLQERSIAPEIDKENVEQSVENEPSLKEKILSALKDIIDSDELDSVTDTLAAKISSKMKQLEDESQQQENQPVSSWTKVGSCEMCQNCVRYGSSEDVPQKLKSFHKGTFGLVSLNQSAFHVKQHKVRHEQTELHMWCYLKSEKVKKDEIDSEMLSENAGLKIVRNAILCLKKSWSSEDFQALNDKDDLTDEIHGKNATKNDSRAEFFALRNIAFDKATQKVKALFQQINFFGLSLDKVTTNRNSYTVLVTYFFWDGIIYVVLNALIKMTSSDYDSSGTADMILKCLQDTLGLSLTEIGAKLVHVSFDAVYADQDQRIRGGGSLSLAATVSQKLGLEEKAITGNIDGAHNLQSTWGDVIKDSPSIMSTINILFDAMKLFHLGKAGTIFLERAQEMEHLVLTNKSHQTTRFVSATLRGATTGLRNLPTIYKILAEDYEAAALAGKNTEAKELDKAMSPLRDTENIAFIIGLIQLLEIYTRVSLANQHLLWFPTQVWNEINEAKLEIQKLSESWEWEEKELHISGIGSPAKHVKNLQKGKFIPYVPINSVRRTPLKERLEIGRSSNFFDEEDQMVASFAGEIDLVGEFDKIENKVKQKLQKISSNLLKRWNERQTETPLQIAAISAFGSPVEYDKTSETGVLEMQGHIQEVLLCLPLYQRQQFDALEATGGYIEWNNFFTANKDLKINEVWKKWIQQLNTEQSKEYSMFINLFQNIQIRSMSEAICETIGSMMVAHGAKGRYLQPKFFSQELYLRFNLGPLHMLTDFCKEIVTERKKEYVRKNDLKKTFHKSVSEESAALRTYRLEQEGKARLPPNVWK